MAAFELGRIGTVGDVAREWRVGRYVPLYLAGIVGGIGIGLGMTLWQSSEPAVQPHAAPAAIVQPVHAAEDVLPVVSETATAPDVQMNFTPMLPVEFTRIFDGTGAQAQAAQAAPAAPAAPVKAVANTAPVAPAKPAAAAPAAPAAPAAAAAPAAPAKPNFYVPAVSAAGPSNLEQRLFDGINAERAKAGLPLYTYDAGLTKIARTRSQQMVDQNYFAHTDPAGYSMYVELLAYFGYTTYNWAGENLALNNYGLTETSERAVVALMNSPTHRANLLAGDFFRVGIGEVMTADGRHIFSMIFLG
jgi:uncharacterized protein YkwD